MGAFLPLDMDERCNHHGQITFLSVDSVATRDFVGQVSMGISMSTQAMSPLQERCWSMRQYMSSFYLNLTILINYMYFLNFSKS